jgi:hypothetical protein
VTKRSHKKVATTASMLVDLEHIVIDPQASNETKVNALNLAYELGLNQGNLDGSMSMAERLTTSAKGNL